MAAKIKALVLLSGGLDSMLATKILQEQGIKVTGLSFKSYFFSTNKAQKAARQLKIPLKIIDFSREHLETVKKPKHGYGKAANPCIDCHLLMLQKTKEIMASGWDFVATGEVLGERPFSQNKKALIEIAEKSGLDNRLLRPLSAAFLPITLPEKKGWVKRNKLPAIKGRSRQIQLALAKKYKIKSFPQPAGGCILTEKEFAKKLFGLFEKWPVATGDDVQLLRLGRHFWAGKTIIVLGRNKEENEKLEKLALKKDILIIPKNFPGPTALLRGSKIRSMATNKAKKLIIQYTKKIPSSPKFIQPQLPV